MGERKRAGFPPAATAIKASIYGSAVTFTPDAGELTNPGYTGCIDRLP